MPSITEGQLIFDFPNDWQASKFDEWSFYCNQFQRVCGGAKAIDILAIDPHPLVLEISRMKGVAWSVH